ncbi:tetratricopeptide repeat protein [Streptomyces sp. M10(2022)]
MGRYEEALADYTRALEINPGSDWMLNGRAQTFLLMGRYEEALADCARSIAIDPERRWGMGVHALALRLAGNEPEAEAEFRRAIRAFAADAAGDGTEAIEASEGLLVMYCALPGGTGPRRSAKPFSASPRPEPAPGSAGGPGVPPEGASRIRPGVDPLVLRLRAALDPAD